MSTSGPVGQVVELLGEAGYESVPTAAPVAGITFRFAAMLAAPGSLDLIAVVDLIIDTDSEDIRRRIEALARALDLVKSRRSLTVVFVGVWPGRALIQSVAGVARVLASGDDDDPDSLRRALAVLLPLELPHDGSGISSPWPETRENLAATCPPESDVLVAAARTSEKAVRDALRKILLESLGPADTETK